MTFKDISHCAQLSNKLNRISKDSSVWKSKEKLSIYNQTVPSEFLTYVLSNGVKALALKDCKILPPKSSPYKNLKLKMKTLRLEDCQGDELIITKALTSFPMEKINLTSGEGSIGPISKNNFHDFVKSLPKTGGELKSLYLGLNHLASSSDLQFTQIKLIVDNCPHLEQLALGCNLGLPNDRNYGHVF